MIDFTVRVERFQPQAAGVTNKLWEVSDLVALLVAAEDSQKAVW